MTRFAGDRLKAAGLSGAKNFGDRIRKGFADAREKSAARHEQHGNKRHDAEEHSKQRPDGDRVRSAIGDAASKVKSAAESLQRSDRD